MYLSEELICDVMNEFLLNHKTCLDQYNEDSLFHYIYAVDLQASFYDKKMFTVTVNAMFILIAKLPQFFTCFPDNLN